MNFPESEFYADTIELPKRKVIAEIPNVGTIVRVNLGTLNGRKYNTPTELPPLFNYLIARAPHSSKSRDSIVKKMTRNRSNQLPFIGLPSSNFVFLDKREHLYMDIMLESKDHDRKTDQEKNITLHDYLREHDQNTTSAYHPYKLMKPSSGKIYPLYSGHIANITPEYSADSGYYHVMLFDRFSFTSLNLSKIDLAVLNRLHKNGILPICAEGYPIYFQ